MTDYPVNPITTVRKGDLVVMVKTRINTALKSEHKSPPTTVYSLVMVGSATRAGVAKTVRTVYNGQAIAVKHLNCTIMTLGLHARHPALLAFFKENDISGVDLGSNKESALEALQNIIAAAEGAGQ